MNSPYSIAQETLGMSSMQRGIGGMTSPVRPGPNAYDQGGASKPSVNTQPYNNQRLAEQDRLQNIGSAAPQAAADAMGQQRNKIAQEADADSKAQMFAATRLSEALYANDSGAKMMKLNAIMQSPEKTNYMHKVALGQTLAQGLSPDFAGEVTNKNRYG
jgi:hypothetical protein